MISIEPGNRCFEEDPDPDRPRDRLAKRLVERGYTLPGLAKSGPVIKVRDLVRGLNDTGGTLRLAESEAQALASLMAAPMAKYSRDFSPTEIDAIEQLFVRVEVTFRVRLRL